MLCFFLLQSRERERERERFSTTQQQPFTKDGNAFVV